MNIVVVSNCSEMDRRVQWMKIFDQYYTPCEEDSEPGYPSSIQLIVKILSSVCKGKECASGIYARSRFPK